jgi:hypothetical protein
MSIVRQRPPRHVSAGTDRLCGNQSIATKLTYVSAATDGQGIIEELLEVVISIRFGSEVIKGGHVIDS